MAIQRNVEQQNAQLLDQILRTTKRFREVGIADGIRCFFAQHDIDFDRCAVIYGETESYIFGYQYGFGGLIVSAEGRFFSVDLELNKDKSEVVFVHKFSDVTDEQNFSKHNRGRGKGLGAIALEALSLLNTC